MILFRRRKSQDSIFMCIFYEFFQFKNQKKVRKVFKKSYYKNWNLFTFRKVFQQIIYESSVLDQYFGIYLSV